MSTELKETMPKELKESMTVMLYQIKNISKETEFFLKKEPNRNFRIEECQLVEQATRNLGVVSLSPMLGVEALKNK